MKTRRINTVIASAYRSAMLASSLTPVRDGATIAATVDPAAARNAFLNAVSGLAAEGWSRSSAETVAAPAPTAGPAVLNVPAADPATTTQLINRLIKLILTAKTESAINTDVCALFNICPGDKDFPIKQATSVQPDG